MRRGNHTTVFIGGAGHSGSTLLGMCLGAHPCSFYAGEAAKSRYLGDATKPERKRMCKLCGPGCPVWGDFVPAEQPDLYEQLSARTGAGILIDSSKSLPWLRAQTARVREGGGRPCFVFLLRDGRAVINSRVRKYPDRDPRDLINEWTAKLAETERFYLHFEGSKARVRYEELATAPEVTLRALCDALGLPFESAMLDFTAGPQHVLGGNNGTQYQVARAQGVDSPLVQLSERTRYYEGHPAGIVLDLRWREELSPRVLALFEDLAGTQNRSLAWDGP